VLRDDRRRELSRKNLIFTMRDKDGGGHVDPNIDEVFAELNR
jgi:3-dehydroquinate dehydratase